MPRDGSGSAHNKVSDEPEHNITHGDETTTSQGVDRSSKAAAPPAAEKGEAIEGMNASGGGNKVEGSGKGTEQSYS
ncbi:hypothetical protein K431DRAFT_309747 [Polychaeton citri CBS 116435]|uniref:Uncharacterized protein n=1 Tax=Polychaeton citri CBS 116435 TaxID=1314669 RepID=A0A9P4QD70_9PEZI|nr:hypothetical protein K431DRAFT_309747 [Polychaeton citri CBS 116435]